MIKYKNVIYCNHSSKEPTLSGTVEPLPLPKGGEGADTLSKERGSAENLLKEARSVDTLPKEARSADWFENYPYQRFQERAEKEPEKGILDSVRNGVAGIGEGVVNGALRLVGAKTLRNPIFPTFS